jgi:hypothetical protein
MSQLGQKNAMMSDAYPFKTACTITTTQGMYLNIALEASAVIIKNAQFQKKPKLSDAKDKLVRIMRIALH